MAQFHIVDSLGNVRRFFRAPKGSWHLVTPQRFALSLDHVTDRPNELILALKNVGDDDVAMLRIIRAYTPGHTVTAL